MLLESLEKKTKLALFTVLLSTVSCTIIVVFTIFYSFQYIQKERSQIYVLDGQIPFLAERASQEANYEMEAKAHIQLFHQYFFNLPPDDDYIKWSVQKAIYMADHSAVQQKNTMEANGFFSDIVATSANCMVVCDSIQLNEDNTFKYYGTEYIKKFKKRFKRSLITSGKLENVRRTVNNPHGLLICDWKTLENKDLNSF